MSLEKLIENKNLRVDDKDTLLERQKNKLVRKSDEDSSDILTIEIREEFYDRKAKYEFINEAIIRENRYDRFIEAGIKPEQAQAILQREEELEMDVLRARYEAKQSGANTTEIDSITTSSILRDEIGDSDYAKYLDARGLSSSVKVRTILKNSPAQFADLRPGDEIISYDYQKAFNTTELENLTYQTDAESLVPVEIRRNGETILLYVEPGPIGIIADRDVSRSQVNQGR